MSRVLVHVEDPGALNFLCDVPDQLASRGVDVDLLADGIAGERLAASPYRRTATLDELFREPPDLIVTGTAENRHSRALDLIARGRAGDIPTGAVVDLPVNAALRFAGTTSDPLAYAPATIWCADDDTVAAFRSLGVPPARLERIANPRLAALRARPRLGAGERDALRAHRFPAWRGQPIVVFAAEPASAVDPGLSHDDGSYTLRGTSGATWRTHIVLEELIATLAREPERPFLVVRLHPKNAPADIAPYAASIDAVDAGGDPADLLALADLVAGMTTMLLQEAAALGVRVISILPRSAERTWLPMLTSGAIRSVTTRRELEVALPAMLAAPSQGLANDDAPALIDALWSRLSASLSRRA